MARTFRLEKLVRDGIVPHMLEMGQVVVSRTLNDDQEFSMALDAKIREEAEEAKTGGVKEVADLQEAIDTKVEVFGVNAEELTVYQEMTNHLRSAVGATSEEVNLIQQERRRDKGGFMARCYVETVTLDDDDPWVDYYANEPDRFKEVAA